MKKLIIGSIIILISLGIIIFLISSPNDNKELNEEIILSEIPESCQQFQDDVCDLFSCMVSLCWCDESISQNSILFEKDKDILNEDQAIIFTKEYLDSIDSNFDLQRAVKLNEFFYNVFAYNINGDEEVFTVSADGKILVTICGV